MTFRSLASLSENYWFPKVLTAILFHYDQTHMHTFEVLSLLMFQITAKKKVRKYVSRIELPRE